MEKMTTNKLLKECFIDDAAAGSEEKRETKKAIITVIGLDRVGIIARVTTILAENSVNILDISQTIMGDLFTMIMVVDFSACPVEFTTLREHLAEAGKELGLSIHVQHEDVFRYMHRI